FLPSSKEEPQHILTAFDSRLVTDALTRGGNPNVQVTPPPAPPADEPATPVALPPLPKPETHEQDTPKPPERKPRPTPDSGFKPVTKPDEDIAPPKKPKIVLSAEDSKLRKPTTKPVKNTSEKDDAEARRAEAAKEAAAAKRRIANAVGSSIRSLDQNLSHATTVELSYPGDGGPLSANYKDVVASIYEAAWTPPAELNDDMVTVTVRVTIARDGRVINGRIIKVSGNSGMDRSIQNVLDTVTFIQPFPAGSTDQERTYTINFNLKMKRGLA
ncbi:MAG TPA: TonB family protein, partial [Verrucomicrobiae bacterium]|nr:TonB family protein [Verrucomicrobiae bacterium]